MYQPAPDVIAAGQQFAAALQAAAQAAPHKTQTEFAHQFILPLFQGLAAFVQQQAADMWLQLKAETDDDVVVGLPPEVADELLACVEQVRKLLAEIPAANFNQVQEQLDKIEDIVTEYTFSDEDEDDDEEAEEENEAAQPAAGSLVIE